jgi:hypothetical protein
MRINCMIWEIPTASGFHLIFNMNKIIPYLFIILSLGCDNSQTPELPAPAKVVMVPRSEDISAIERGIDAVPESNGIKLQWYDSMDRNLKIYSVFRRKTKETYFRVIKTIDLETAFPGQDTVYIDNDPDLPLNSYNYYYVTGTNKDDLEGPPSDTLKYKLLEKPQNFQPNGQTITGLPVFYWSFPATVTPDSFILRIEDDLYNTLNYVAKFGSNYDQPEQTLDLSDTSKVSNPPVFNSGQSYRWRIDSIGPDAETSGAESAWLIFFIN